MIEENTLLQGEPYKIQRLVMVNSGSAAYVEIPLDKTAALLSKNNKGKTSALNALKLFLLPEVNFRDCKNKFGFSSGGKDYSDLESYNYYFPSSTSFIILEANNLMGEFCIVLHQTPRLELGYSRIAVPLSYVEIRHLFWDEKSNANQGLGSHPSGMSLSDIQSSLNNLDSIQLNDPVSISNTIYTRVSPLKPETRFCIMPLVQPPKPAMIRSIKSLLQLSFDIKGADTKNLPLAFANIIDSDIATSREPINIDFKKIQADKKRLRNDAEHIQALRNHRTNWQNLVEAYGKQQLASQTWESQFKSLDSCIRLLNEQYEPYFVEVFEKQKRAKIEFESLKETRSEHNNKISDLQGQLKRLKRQSENLSVSINLGKNVIAREKMVVESDDPLAISQHLKEYLSECEKRLETFRDREESEKRLSILIGENNKLCEAIRELEEKISQNKPALLSLISERSAQVLNSINTDFECLTIRPMDSQIRDIEAFACLFETSGSNLDFCGERLPTTEVQAYKRDSYKDRLQAVLASSSERQESVDNEIQSIKRFLSASAPLSKSMIEEKEAEIIEIRKEILAVTGLSSNESQYNECAIELEAIEQSIESVEGVLQNIADSYLSMSNTLEDCSAELEKVEKKHNAIKSTRKDLERSRTLASEIALSTTGSEILDDLSDIDIGLLSERVASLDDLFTSYKSFRDKTIENFRSLTVANIAPIDPELPYRCDLNSSEFFDAYSKLRSEFDNLEHKEKELLSQIRNHNHETSVEISMLDSMARAISNFETRINTDLGDVHISNLSGVKLEIVTLEGFNTLRKELESHGTTSDELMDDSFYDRLSHFCEKYLTDGNRYGKLNLEKIIKEIRFLYEINGQKESTSQSNGTSGMVNAVLLSILMRRLVPEDITFTLPVVFDEIGSLDEDNLPELRRVVEANHFVLLVANPNNNGYIAFHIGNWHDIYLYRMSEGNVINKCIAIYFANAESLELTDGDGILCDVDS